MKRLLLALIRWYREKISPCTPPCCRFLPTCSAYALEAVEVHGALKGALLSLWRILRCHPFHRDQSFIYDPVPPPGRSRLSQRVGKALSPELARFTEHFRGIAPPSGLKSSGAGPKIRKN